MNTLTVVPLGEYLFDFFPLQINSGRFCEWEKSQDVLFRVAQSFMKLKNLGDIPKICISGNIVAIISIVVEDGC